MNYLWEILVPCNYNDGKPVKTRHHKEWDKVVKKISGGLTIYRPVIGKWDSRGTTYVDRVIPVRICCTEKDINKIAQFTIKHYRQLAVMVYVVSEKVLIITDDKKRKDTKNVKLLRES